MRKWPLASSCLSVHPSVCMEQLGSHWMGFHEIWYLSIFQNSVIKIQVSLKSDKNNRYFAWRPIYPLFFFLNHAVCEVMWKNMVEPYRSQMTTWWMCIACWVHKSTNTHSEYVVLIVFHCNNGCTNTPQYYIIHTLPVMLHTNNVI